MNFQLPTYRNMTNHLNLPQVSIDVQTRWNSTYLMLKSLMRYKSFCLRNVDAALNLGQSEWESMEALLALLEPVYVATQMLQEEQLFYSDFFKIWLQMKLDVQTKPVSAKFLTILERREKVLLKNPTLLAALYLDPRLQRIIAKEPLQLMCARTHLKEVIIRILQLENQILDPSFRNDIKLIKHLSLEEKRNFLKSFDQVFCDCDGVIWQTMRDAVPGSAGGINFLRNNGKQVTFVTNNSITTIDEQLRKFQLCNITVEKSDVVHPAQTICEHLQEIQFEGLIYCIASTPFKELLREAGFQLVEDPARILSETVHDLRAAIYNKDPVKAVIIDVDFNLTAAKLMRAHVHLKNPDCLFIAGAADTLIPFGAEDVIGPGPFISVVENSSKREATVLGKPGRHLCERLKTRFALTDPSRALFIGDSLSSDISFGKMCGFQTLLVLSGGTKAHDLATQLHKYEAPDHVLDCLGDFVQLFKECA